MRRCTLLSLALIFTLGCVLVPCAQAMPLQPVSFTQTIDGSVTDAGLTYTRLRHRVINTDQITGDAWREAYDQTLIDLFGQLARLRGLSVAQTIHQHVRFRWLDDAGDIDTTTPWSATFLADGRIAFQPQNADAPSWQDHQSSVYLIDIDQALLDTNGSGVWDDVVGGVPDPQITFGPTGTTAFTGICYWDGDQLTAPGVNYTLAPVTAVPEPASLLGMTLGGLSLLARRGRR